jgi:LysM repeat protein
MKILKIFGVVVGIHVFALMLIFANPGCSSTSRPIPAPSDTLPPGGSGPTVSVPLPSNTVSMPGAAAPSMPPPSFNPDAPATSGSTGVRFTPTRPGTAAATTLAPEQKIDVTPATTYTVMTGDNLWTLTKKFNLTNPAQLAAANNLKTNAVLHPGQKLIIPGRAMAPNANGTQPPAASAVTATTKTGETPAVVRPVAGESVKHLVKPGESLSLIAQQYGVKQGDIAVANNISDPNRIRPGMELIIPGWQAATKTGKAPAPRPAAAKSTAPVFNVEGPSAAPPPSNAPVPVIQIDDSPLAPAPKSP